MYGYYIIIAAYGWWNWSRPTRRLSIKKWKPRYHLLAMLIGISLSVTLGFTFERFTDAENPYWDAFTTIFSFIASVLEAKKIMSSWVYWIIINLVTVGLYFSKSLDIYAALMVLYFIMSIVGYSEWKKAYSKQLSPI